MEAFQITNDIIASSQIHYLAQLFFPPQTLIEARKYQFTNERSDCFQGRGIKMRSNVIGLQANYHSGEINRPTVMVFAVDLFCIDGGILI